MKKDIATSAQGAKMSRISRRNLLLGGAAASVGSLLSAQMPSGGGPGTADAPPAGGPQGAAGAQNHGPNPFRGPAQGGTGPIKVLFITKFHPFDREGLFSALDQLGKDITWTHVEHPAAEAFYDLKLAEPYDVFLFYDAYTGRVQTKDPDGTTKTDYEPPSPQAKTNFKQLLQSGDKGFFFLHHAIASWVHTWPEYVEVMGGAADWGTPLKNIRGKDYPASGAKQNVQEHITIVDRNHPVTQGVDDFDIVDEVYLCPMFEDSVHCLMRTDFKPIPENFGARAAQLASHPPGSNMTGWVKTAERSPVVYIQHGHDIVAWQNPAWQKLVLNGIKWVASKEAKDWAHANPKKIFA